MSASIIRRWKLAVLRVGMDLSGRVPMVRSRLAGYTDDLAVACWDRCDPLSDFGLSLSGEFPRSVRVPIELQRAVEESMRTDLSSESALWLRLEPPYGYLGAAPWEDLADRIHVPVLRVPNRLPVAASLGDTWRVTMIVSTPSRARWGAAHVRSFAAALGAAAESGNLDRFEIDVFSNVTVYRQLMDRAPALPHVRIHDPSAFVHRPRTRPAPHRVGGTRRIESDHDPRLVWADWITDRLGSHAASALHVASVGLPSVDRSMLEMSADPASVQPTHGAATADANDLWSLADAIGASLVSIASPEHDRRDIGARMVADRLGQLRPGPTIFSSIDLDPDARALARVHSFLAMQEDNELPNDRSWFGYIQPETIQHALALPLPSPDIAGTTPALPPALAGALTPTIESFTATAPFSKSYEGDSDVPRWVASSSRYIETRRADMSNVIARGALSAEPPSPYEHGASDALDAIQDLITRHLGDPS